MAYVHLDRIPEIGRYFRPTSGMNYPELQTAKTELKYALQFAKKSMKKKINKQLSAIEAELKE